MPTCCSAVVDVQNSSGVTQAGALFSNVPNAAAGMVASAFEFADVCRKHDYHNFLFSMKASNPLVMASAYRLLAEEQYNRGWDYPLHLGVTGARLLAPQ